LTQAERKETHDPNIKLNSSTQRNRIRIPRNIPIPIRHAVHIIRPHDPRNTHDKSSPKKHRNHNALAKRKVETKNDGDGEKHDAEVVEDVEAAFDEEVNLLVDTALRGV